MGDTIIVAAYILQHAISIMKGFDARIENAEIRNFNKGTVTRVVAKLSINDKTFHWRVDFIDTNINSYELTRRKPLKKSPKTFFNLADPESSEKLLENIKHNIKTVFDREHQITEQSWTM